MRSTGVLDKVLREHQPNLEANVERKRSLNLADLSILFNSYLALLVCMPLLLMFEKLVSMKKTNV